MGFVVTEDVLESDPHFYLGCTDCHAGDSSQAKQEDAHKGLIARPSDDPEASCGQCHEETAKNYTLSLHYTAAGMKHGVMPRFDDKGAALFKDKVFEQSCRSCHASCGDCHVKSPDVSGISTGLLDGHRFVKKAEDKTCALCHGGRVWPEFTGDYGGSPDVHYRKGMTCIDCHSGEQFHGDGTAYTSRKQVVDKPSCTDCHDLAKLGKDATKETHATHAETVSCSACHTASAYRQCSSCHLGGGAVSNPAIVLGHNPRIPGQLTTLRLIPTQRETFKPAGISMTNFDALPNYWDTVPHNIAKRTDRTRDCNTCHQDGTYYFDESRLPEGGSTKNLELVP
jgi:thiosulfate/3-mercaptopyruvate sulfurtransferase